MNKKSNNSANKQPLQSIRPSIFDAVFRVFAVTLAILLVHRFLTYSFLADATPTDSNVAAMFVGGLSDVWVAFLLATLVASASLAVSVVHPAAGKIIQVGFLILLSLGLCAHQGYVEFFRFQIEPFHVKYLYDWQFLTSNASGFLTLPNLGLISATMIATAVVLYRKTWISTKKSDATLFIIIAITALAAHNRNIHYRVQWFIPENLQTNLFETVYLRTKRLDLSQRPSVESFTKAKKYYKETSFGSDKYDLTIFSSSNQANATLHPVASVLKNHFQTSISENKTPIILVVLLESLRPSETGLFSTDKQTLTPTIDALANQGIWFKKAYSTGSVTRSGQEAALCGNFSGRNTSLMRNFDTVPYQCITDSPSKSGVGSFWYHGGDGRFDGQEAFWRRHNIKDVLTRNSFPEDAPRTDWGIGDKAFFKQAAQRLIEKHLGKDQNRFFLGMMLSLTNHIPWTLPSDFSGLLEAEHPSFLTTKYTDESIGVLESSLKASNLWESTIIFIVSDHGNKTVPYTPLYGDISNKNQALQSHVNMIISGGMTEAAVKIVGESNIAFDHYVSQSDVAATIAYIAGLEDFRVMGKNLFEQDHNFPIFSQTEEGLYVPKLDLLITYNDAAKQLPNLEAEDFIYRFHFKAATEFLIELKSKSR